MDKVFSLQLFGDNTALAEASYYNQQKFPWGEAIWLTEPDERTMSRVTAGLITFYPFSSQPEHSHRREEQVLYIVSGRGEQIVDGVRYPITSGSYFHIRPHSRHVVVNNSAEDLRVLVIYIYYPLSPFGRESDEFKPWYADFMSDKGVLLAPPPEGGVTLADVMDAAACGPEPYFSGLSDEFFDLGALQSVLDHLSQVLEVSISLLDHEGGYLFQTGNRASFCAALVEASGGGHCRNFFREVYAQVGDSVRPYFFSCCHNIASIIVPIQYHGKVAGFLKCGEIMLSTADREVLLGEAATLADRYGLDVPALRQAVNDLPIEPKSRLYTVAEATMAIARAIINQAESKRRQHELDKSRLSLVQEQLAKASLEKALHESGLKLLQSQVNPHFLFNTLNTISQMAYLEGAVKASGLTRDLSELLRYTLRKSEQLIPLQDEIGLLRHYINIQKERFGDRIRFAVTVDEASVGDMSRVAIPCMILQPLVENAIVHGLESRVEGGGVEIALWADGTMLMARVRDNGCGFDPEAVRHSAENRVGLKSTRSRLALHYGDNFRFSFQTAPGEGCEITLGMPFASPLDADGSHEYA